MRFNILIKDKMITSNEFKLYSEKCLDVSDGIEKIKVLSYISDRFIVIGAFIDSINSPAIIKQWKM